MPDEETTLPTRVLRAIQVQQDASERLVGWFQLGFVLFFGLLYLAAKLEKHTKAEGVSAICTASAFEQAHLQGYQPPDERQKRTGRNVEGIEKLLDIVVLAE